MATSAAYFALAPFVDAEDADIRFFVPAAAATTPIAAAALLKNDRLEFSSLIMTAPLFLSFIISEQQINQLNQSDQAGKKLSG
jgi:hypothetical protein